MPTPPLVEALAAYRDQLRPPAGPTRSRLRGRPVLIGALVAVVAVSGAAVWLRPARPSPAGQVADTPSAAAARPPAAATGGELATPPPTRWRSWFSPVVATWLPTIAGAGPADPDRLAGFAHSPAGALAAAASLHPVIYYTRDRSQWQFLADRRVVWAAGQREQLADALDTVWDAHDPVPTAMTPVGYRLVSYTPARARLRLWWRFDLPAGASAAGAIAEVTWTGGDWALFFDEPAMDLRAATARDSWLPWGPA